jgi:Methyltransferase domain
MSEMTGLPPVEVSELALDYPVRLTARDPSASPHMRRLTERLTADRGAYRDILAGFADRYGEKLCAIPVEPSDDLAEPHWRNDWLPGLDAAAIYGFLADRRPRTYFEVGSGHSTKFARRAIQDLGLATRIVSVDPAPRAEIDALCDEMHRCGFEELDLNVLDALEPGDIVFVDNSHRAFPNSDVTVFFTEALGRLPRGCLWALHDIFLPWDYPDVWARQRFYSEQYLLAAYLFGGADEDQIVLPARFISDDVEVTSALDQLWNTAPRFPRNGGAFWMTKG